MDKIIKPSAKAPLWFIRMGLYFLFPPVFIFTSIIGYFVASSDAGALVAGYIISMSAASLFSLGMSRGTTFQVNPKTVSHNLNFLWSKRKEVLLANVKEVELKVSLLQRIFGLGTVVMHTQASSTGNNKTGLSFSDIENPSKVYEFLKEAVSSARVG